MVPVGDTKGKSLLNVILQNDCEVAEYYFENGSGKHKT